MPAVASPNALVVPTLQAPLVVGGGAPDSVLTLRATRGVGAGSEAIRFEVGDDGATLVLSMDGNGLTTLGFGDNQNVFPSAPTTPLVLSILQGTAASPYTGVAPLVKFVRTVRNDGTALLGDGSQQMALLQVQIKGDADNTAQPVGVFSGVENQGIASYSAGVRPDAVPFYGVGKISGSGIGTGYGAALYGRVENDVGIAVGIEFASQNYGTADEDYQTATFPRTRGAWTGAVGNFDSAVGLYFGAGGGGTQYDVAIALNGIGGGPSKTADFQTNSLATTVFKIEGTHTNLLTGSATAGPVRVIGGFTGGTDALTLTKVADVHVQSTNADATLRLVRASGASFQFTAAAALATLGTLSATDLQFITSNANKMRLTAAGSLVIGATAVTNASALLELTSTTGALVVSRMTSTQRDALTATVGMLIYNTTTGTYQIYDGAWKSVTVA